jgi:hypothetical protein
MSLTILVLYLSSTLEEFKLLLSSCFPSLHTGPDFTSTFLDAFDVGPAQDRPGAVEGGDKKAPFSRHAEGYSTSFPSPTSLSRLPALLRRIRNPLHPPHISNGSSLDKIHIPQICILPRSVTTIESTIDVSGGSCSDAPINSALNEPLKRPSCWTKHTFANLACYGGSSRRSRIAFSTCAQAKWTSHRNREWRCGYRHNDSGRCPYSPFSVHCLFHYHMKWLRARPWSPSSSCPHRSVILLADASALLLPPQRRDQTPTRPSIYVLAWEGESSVSDPRSLSSKGLGAP